MGETEPLNSDESCMPVEEPSPPSSEMITLHCPRIVIPFLRQLSGKKDNAGIPEATASHPSLLLDN